MAPPRPPPSQPRRSLKEASVGTDLRKTESYGDKAEKEVRVLRGMSTREIKRRQGDADEEEDEEYRPWSSRCFYWLMGRKPPSRRETEREAYNRVFQAAKVHLLTLPPQPALEVGNYVKLHGRTSRTGALDFCHVGKILRISNGKTGDGHVLVQSKDCTGWYHPSDLILIYEDGNPRENIDSANDGEIMHEGGEDVNIEPRQLQIPPEIESMIPGSAEIMLGEHKHVVLKSEMETELEVSGLSEAGDSELDPRTILKCPRCDAPNAVVVRSTAFCCWRCTGLQPCRVLAFGQKTLPPQSIMCGVCLQINKQVPMNASAFCCALCGSLRLCNAQVASKQFKTSSDVRLESEVVQSLWVNAALNSTSKLRTIAAAAKRNTEASPSPKPTT